MPDCLICNCEFCSCSYILQYLPWFIFISEDEEEDFSKGAEEFVEAAKKRRRERQSDNGENLQLTWPWNSNCFNLSVFWHTGWLSCEKCSFVINGWI